MNFVNYRTPLVALMATHLLVFPRATSQEDEAWTILIGEEVFLASVKAVEDGDSLVVDQAGEKYRLHLDGVDAPELTQAFGPQAKAFLLKLVDGKTVTVRLKARHTREGGEDIARVEVNGDDASTTLLRDGLGWYCAQGADDRELTRAEKEARLAKAGLWSAEKAIPPWQYRGEEACWTESKGG